MRRWFYRVAVVAVTALGLLLLPAEVQAQRGGHGGGRGGGGRVGGFHGGGFRGGPGRFRGGFERGFVGRPVVGIGIGGWGWWGWPGWYDGWWGWRRPWIWDSYYGGYVSPDYSYVYEEYPPEGYTTEEYAEPAYTEVPAYQTEAGNVAHVTVVLPTPDAKLYFNDARMLAQGRTRTFNTPPLEPGEDYYYTVRVRWMENGKKVEKTRTLNVRAGQNYTLDFTQRRAGREEGAVRHEEPDGRHAGEIRERTDKDRVPSDHNRLNSDTNGRSQSNPNPVGP
jgi:uncharacterized protein (TIGR03000 family)